MRLCVSGGDVLHTRQCDGGTSAQIVAATATASARFAFAAHRHFASSPGSSARRILPVQVTSGPTRCSVVLLWF